MPRKRPSAPPVGPPVLIDTNIWVAFDRGRDPAVRRRVEKLQKQRRATFIPPVLLEFARGLAGPGAAFEFAFARYRTDFPVLPLEPDDWLAAVRLARLVTGGRHAVQSADLLLAAVSVRTGALVWSRDPDLPRLADADSAVRLYRT